MLLYQIQLIQRTEFNCMFQIYFIELVNSVAKNIKDKNDLLCKIIENQYSNIPTFFFSDLFLIEQNYIFNKIELDKKIAPIESLKENIFLLFISILTKIPLIITGNPGSGKNLSFELIHKVMRGKYSKSTFFRNKHFFHFQIIQHLKI